MKIITVIPRLARFFIARICTARIFEAANKNFHSTILCLSYTIEIIEYSAMQIFLEFFSKNIFNFRKIKKNDTIQYAGYCQ